MPLFADTCKKQMDGRIVVITGANTGIGKETARDMCKRDARVIILCRDTKKGEDAAEEIRKDTKGTIEVQKLDLSSLQSVRDCASHLNQTLDKINILVNNAGVMMCPLLRTEDGFEMQFGTNHLGHFLLTELLLPLLEKSAESGFHPRIVNVSSSGHNFSPIHFDDLNWNKSYDKIAAYGQSKLANVMHASELARRLKDKGITTYSLHPGAINTELQRHVEGVWYWRLLLTVGRHFFKTPVQGAQTTLYCCLDDAIETHSGKYYSDCKETRPNARALVEADQDRLYEESKKLVGL